MRVLVTGGTGWIGRHLVVALRREEHAVRVLSRHESRPVEFDDAVEMIRWPSVLDPIPEGAILGIDAVINLAGASIGAGRWSHARKHELYKSRIETTQRLIEAINHSPWRPTVMISMSAVGYYGFHGDEQLTEADQPGDDFLAGLCMHWEDVAKQAVTLGLRLVIARTGLVLGTGSEALRRMAQPFKWFVGGPIGSGRQVMSWVHLDDVIGVMLYALANQHVSGPINVTAPNPVRNREFSKALARVLHRPSLFPAPAFMLRLMLGEMSAIALTGQRVVPRQLLEFGYQFQYTEVEDALRVSL